MIRMALKQSHLAAAITKLPNVIAFDFLLEVIRMALKQSHLAAAVTKLPNVIAFSFCLFALGFPISLKPTTPPVNKVWPVKHRSRGLRRKIIKDYPS